MNIRILSSSISDILEIIEIEAEDVSKAWEYIDIAYSRNRYDG